MFIDEGFGSLDEESLNQAINVLHNLTEGDRMIGIISHVSEIKERIEKQIIVKSNHRRQQRNNRDINLIKITTFWASLYTHKKII